MKFNWMEFLFDWYFEMMRIMQGMNAMSEQKKQHLRRERLLPYARGIA